mgnify:CR=1 FL=1
MSVLLSLAAHAGAVALLSWVAILSLSRRELDRREAHGRQIDVGVLELSPAAEGTKLSDERVDPRGATPTPRGGVSVAHVDDGRVGAGGERKGERAEHLANQNDRLRLTTDLPSHLDADQSPRVASGSKRRSQEDRRSSREPMELTFLAQGDLERMERRAASAADPSRGARALGATASVAGGRLGGDEEGTELPGQLGAANVGSRLAAPGQGVLDGRPGTDHRDSAAVARARPQVAEQNPSVPALERGRAQDTVDSEQQVSRLVHSLVHASVAGGDGRPGAGGTAGGGEAGSGALSGRGSHAGPLGLGDGTVVDLGTRDPRLMPYFRALHAKIDPLWAHAFPKSAMYELKQGTVILEFTVRANGSVRVSWPPVRPSGIDEFDRNCADAIRRAAPFAPIPAELGLRELRIRAPFDAKNPIVK